MLGELRGLDPGVQLVDGELVILGVAWSGAAPIKCVDIRIGDLPWQQARLIGDRQRHRWQWWESLTHLDEPGPATVRARVGSTRRPRNGNAFQIFGLML